MKRIQYLTSRRLAGLTGILAVIAVALLVVGCESSPATLQKQAKVSKADAERIALAQAPGGSVKSSELEKEKGVLVWSFDIARPGTTDITEVLVDATNGSVVGVENETAAQEAEEEDQPAEQEKAK